MNLEQLKRLVIKRHEAGIKLKEVEPDKYPEVLKAYYDTNLEVIEFSNQWVQAQENDLVIFEIENRIYMIKQRRGTSYKYIGYLTKPEEVEL